MCVCVCLLRFPLYSTSLPLNADRCEEADPNEVPGHGGESPEEVLSQVSLLQRKVLIGLQAGGDLRQWVGMALVKCLLPEVLILEVESAVVR